MDSHETPAKEFEYRHSPSLGGVIITKYIGPSPHVRIPREIDGADVVRLGDFHIGLDNRVFVTDGILSIYVPDTVKVIGYGAFNECVDLRTVRLPASLKKISNALFFGCVSLESIEIPDTVKEIGTAAFKGCAAMTAVKVPKGAVKIGMGAFDGCAGLGKTLAPWLAENQPKPVPYKIGKNQGEERECTCGYRISASGGCSCGV